jgi:hypothetical protein
MPKGEYSKHLARNSNNKYVGTELEREWSEEELENTFSIYGAPAV